MHSEHIIAKLEGPTDDRRQLLPRLVTHEKATNIISALAVQPASPLTRQLLCDILGFKKAPGAVAVLVTSLHDADDGVRCSAADAHRGTGAS